VCIRRDAAVPGNGDGLRGLVPATAAPPPPTPGRGALGGVGRRGQPVAQRHRGRLRGGGLLSLLVRTASAGALRLQQRATQWARAPPFLFYHHQSPDTHSNVLTSFDFVLLALQLENN